MCEVKCIRVFVAREADEGSLAARIDKPSFCDEVRYGAEVPCSRWVLVEAVAHAVPDLFSCD